MKKQITKNSHSFTTAVVARMMLLCFVAAVPVTRAAVVNYTTQTASLGGSQVQDNTSPPFAGIYNNTASQLGIYANGGVGSVGSNPQAVGFYKFTTDGNQASAAQALRVGQQVTVTLGMKSGGIVGNSIGFGLNNGTDFSAVSKYNNNGRLEYSFTAGDSSAATYDSLGKLTAGLPGYLAFSNSLSYTITMVSKDEYNFQVSGGGATYNVNKFGGTVGNSIDSLAIFNRGFNSGDALFSAISITDITNLTYTANAGETKNVTGAISDNGSITNTATKLGVGIVNFQAANTYSGNTVISNGTLAVTSGGAINSPLATLNIGPGATAATNTLLSGGAIIVQSLLATNVVLNGVTNSIFNFSGGTLTTSNNNGIASSIMLASNASFNISGSWNMNAGTNIIASVQTNSSATSWGAIYFGNFVNNLTIKVNTNAVFQTGIASISPTNLTLIVGNGSATNNLLTVNNGALIATNVQYGQAGAIIVGANGAANGNQLVVTNGGQVFGKYQGGGNNVSVDIGSSGTSNSLVVIGTNAAGLKAALNCGADRFYVGNGATGGSNGWARVDQGGIITNTPLTITWGLNNSIIITNGGQFFAAQTIIGRGGAMNNSILVAGADVAGNKASLSFGANGLLLGGNETTTIGNASTNCWAWAGQGGIITNTGRITVGANANAVGNYLIVTNGGQAFSAADSVVGYAASANSNWVSIGGNNAFWNLGNKKLTIGNDAAATNNSVTLFAGGALTNVSSVVLGGVGSLLNFNGGTLAASASGNLISQTGVNATNFVQSGGAVIDSVANTVTNLLPMLQDPNSTGGGLTKLGSGSLWLLGTNTYTGTTTISNGTLALGANGSISNSAQISILAGTTLDVSAITTFNLSSSTSLSASGSASAATIKGNASANSVNLGSRPITLNYNGSNPALTVSQGQLVLNGNTITINGSALGNGSYVLITNVGNTISQSGSFIVTGTAIGSNTGTLDFSTPGSVKLTISAPAAGPASAANSTVVASPASLAADNSSTSTVTVTLKDASNNPLGAGTNVSWTVSGTANTVTPASSGTTSGSGVTSFTVKSLKAETKTVTVTVGATTITNALTITFTVPGGGNVFNWDPSQTPSTASDGSGTWNTSTANWTNNGADYIWPNNGNDTAIFGGTTAGGGSGTFTVTLATDVLVGNLNLKQANGGGNYNIGSVAATTPTITMNGGAITCSKFGAINYPVNGSYVIAGTSTLTFGANSTPTNITINSAAILQVGNSGVDGSLGSANITNNGILQYAVAPSGSYIISNAVTGAGRVIYKLKNAPVATTFSATATQSYTGTTTIQPQANNVSGILRIDADNRLPAGTDLTVSQSTFTGSTNIVDLNGKNQTLGSIDTDAGSTVTSSIVTNTSATASTLTLAGASKTKFFNGNIAGNINLTLNGSGSTLTLSNACTYSGNTTISAGTLALSGGGSITNSSIIGITNGAMFNVSGLSATFTLGGSQTLTNLGSGAIINGTNNTGSGTVSLLYGGVNPSFIITNGGMTLSASTVFKVNNTGAALGAGTYLIISNITAGTAGLVAGTAPSVTLNGNTFANTTAALLINSSGLNLVIKTNQTITFGSGTSLTKTYGDAPFADTATASSGLTVAYYSSDNAVATVDGSGNVTITGAGSCSLIATNAGNGTYNPAFVSQSLTVNKATTTITYGSTSFSYNGSAQAPTITFSGSTGAKTTNYVGTSATTYSSVNAPTNAGTYYVSNTVVADANYFGTTNSTNFTIDAKAASVTADAKSKTYGDVNPVLTAVTNGAVNGDVINVTITTTATQFSSVGVSNITVTAGSNPNYTVQTTNSTLTINPASTFVGASSTNNPSGFRDAVFFQATLPADATGSVVFSSTNGAFSTNAVSSGSASSLSITNLPRGTNLITVAYFGDGNYVGSTNTLNQIVTNHLPVVNNAGYTRNAAVNTFKITVTNLLSNATDADGDTLTLVAISATTNSATAMIGGGYVLYYNTNAVADEFTYKVSDGFGGTNSATVTINVDSTPLFGQSAIASITGGAATLKFAGIPGFNYSVSRSTNLISWTVIWTTNAPPDGLFQYIDSPAPQPSAYYRLQFNP